MELLLFPHKGKQPTPKRNVCWRLGAVWQPVGVLQGPELRWIGLRVGPDRHLDIMVDRMRLKASASIHVGKLCISRGHPILTLLVSAYHHLRAVYYISVELGGAKCRHI